MSHVLGSSSFSPLGGDIGAQMAVGAAVGADAGPSPKTATILTIRHVHR